jgi:dTMP kinase
LIGYWKKSKKNAYTNPLGNAPKKFVDKFGFLLRFLYFIDFQIKAFFEIRLPLMLGKCIICDRYFYDLLMELDRSDLLSKKFTKLISQTLPRPMITFLLDVPENLARERRAFSNMELRSKRKTFLKMSKIFNLVIIDSSKDFLSNQMKIRSTVLSRIKQN